MKINNKTFLVTGAGGGIGGELVLGLLNRGAKVVACDLREETLVSLKESAGDKADALSTFVVNITDRKAVEALPEQVGEIDGLINNAGIIQPFVKINELDYEAVERVMKVNFYGPLYLIKTFLPTLLKRPEAHIINVSSMGGFLPVPGQSVYGASKAAVKLMTEGLYAELKNTNVKVSVVFPGATETNITQNSGLKVPKSSAEKQPKISMLSPKKVAAIILDGVERDKFQIYTGNDSKMMNLLYRLNPQKATDLIAKQMASLLK